MKKQSSLNVGIKLFVMGLCWSMAYMLPFIQYTFYDPLLEALDCTNTQLGFLMTMFGVFNLIGAPLGGWLSDRFDCKKLYVGSMVLNALVSAILLVSLNYTMALIVWVGLAISTLVMNYPAHIKLVRIIAGEGQNAKIFGFNESFIGLGGIIVNAAIVYIFSCFANDVAGMKGIVVANIVLCLVVAVLLLLVLRDVDTTHAEKASGEKAEKIGGKDFLKVIASPATWLLGLSIFCVYTCAVTMSYFTPYYTAAFGGAVTVGAALSVIRTHGMKLAGGPVGGILSDKLGSPSKALIIVNILGVISLVTLLLLPGGATTIFIALTLIIALVVYMGKGSYYAVATELYVPEKYAATTVGVAAALGFSPDIFLFPLVGYWIDNYGVDGYRYTFIFQICVMVVGVLCGFTALAYKKKKAAAAAR